MFLVNLYNDDVVFIKNFLLAFGSLKEIAKQYIDIYPTVRLRMDKLIQKINISEDKSNVPFVSLTRELEIMGVQDLGPSPPSPTRQEQSKK